MYTHMYVEPYRILIHLVVKAGIRYPPASLSILYSETGSSINLQSAVGLGWISR